MHSKVIFVRKAERGSANSLSSSWTGWAYVGSANMSESAW